MMNLYIRFFWSLLRLLWVPRSTDPLASTTLTMRVMPNDLDLNFHVNNSRYLALMDIGRFHLMGVNSVLSRTLSRGWWPVLGSAKVHFFHSLKAFERFTMCTQVVYWDDKWLYVEQKIMKKDKLCASALFKVLFLGKKGKIPSKKLLAIFPHRPSQKPPLPNNLRLWLDAEKWSHY